MLKSKLKPHQERVVRRIQEPDRPGLVVAHGLGSGKTLTSIASREALGLPGIAVVPASLQENYRKEIQTHTRGKPNIAIQSLQNVASKGKRLSTGVLAVDEAHRLRDPSTKSYKAIESSEAAKKILLTASPMYNHPSDIAPLVNLAAGKKVLPVGKRDFEAKFVAEKAVSPGFFDRLRGVKPGVIQTVNPRTKGELQQVMSKWVDYHPNSSEDFPSRTDEVVKVPMSSQQKKVYDSILGKAPLWVRLKVRSGMPPNKTEAKQMNAFLTATRQVGLSTAPFTKNPEQGYEAPKIDAAVDEMEKGLKHPRFKGLAYSNFLGAGLKPYEERLQKKGIPYGVFTGEMRKKERDQVVRDFNAGKKRVLLVSRAGGEGLDLKGTRLVQVLDPHWNEEAIKQVIGRAQRYRSHSHLPENERDVRVQRFHSTTRPGLLHRFGIGKQDLTTDEYLDRMSQSKEELNAKFTKLLEG